MTLPALPQTLADLEAFIRNGIPESLHLDYKRSPALCHAKRDEIAKDVSAFANSDGGLLIYGIEERGHLPTRLDEGVPQGISREWIENVLRPAIRPQLPSLTIQQIPCSEGSSYFALSVAKSHVGPHQAPDFRFYKRFNFSSYPMDAYEIDDIRLRRVVHDSLVRLDVEVRYDSFHIVLFNPGRLPASDVRLHFTPPLVTRPHTPPALTEGLTSLPPGRRLSFRWLDTHSPFKDPESIPLSYNVSVEYYHPARGERISEETSFSLRDFLGTSGYHDPTAQLTEALSRLSSTLSNLRFGSIVR